MDLHRITFKPEFKAELTTLELYGIDKLIEVMDEEGLLPELAPADFAYTSAGAYAAYHHAGEPYHLEDPEGGRYQTLQHIAVTPAGVVFIVTRDAEEQRSYYRVDY